jgi:hypothetical protein
MKQVLLITEEEFDAQQKQLEKILEELLIAFSGLAKLPNTKVKLKNKS